MLLIYAAHLLSLITIQSQIILIIAVIKFHFVLQNIAVFICTFRLFICIHRFAHPMTISFIFLCDKLNKKSIQLSGMLPDYRFIFVIVLLCFQKIEFVRQKGTKQAAHVVRRTEA